MDPITLGILVVLFSAVTSTGLTLAKSPLARAQYAGAVRGAVSGGRTAATDRWAKTAPKRSAVWSGRRRWMSGLAIGPAQIGQAALQDWDMARAVGRTARRGVQSAVPMAVGVSRGVLSGARDGYRTGRQSYSRRLWDSVAEACDKCGRREEYLETFGFYWPDQRLCDECVKQMDRKYPSGWPDPADIPTANVDPAPEGPQRGLSWDQVKAQAGCLALIAYEPSIHGPSAPRYCGQAREDGWVLCAGHLTEERGAHGGVRTDEDLQEFRPTGWIDPAPTQTGDTVTSITDRVRGAREFAGAARQGAAALGDATRGGNGAALLRGQRPAGGGAGSGEIAGFASWDGLMRRVIADHESQGETSTIVQTCRTLTESLGAEVGAAMAQHTPEIEEAAAAMVAAWDRLVEAAANGQKHAAVLVES